MLIHSIVPAVTLLLEPIGAFVATPHHRLERVAAGITLFIIFFRRTAILEYRQSKAYSFAIIRVQDRSREM
ncbi:hypothetical protein SIAM614_01294 [Stappia aggregata IAM 12614]|uniref:Uncharacterized protein n=1 Tax=Roseibium aggregatum (strain ATCC 25650 / DSM 13394 / JCM 20685 / NBRC 16684 / NCIMB 2208 / IAM 12614 / B1) TaxID=384765 RepID=A0P0R9_ROSAI|nr:hypothetical protein SIAM614_01294 [Stappia aggregata IAM 12614] [Roseibium aggregatum IAM 12614]